MVQPHSCHGSSQSPCSQHHLALPRWDQFGPWRFRFGVRVGWLSCTHGDTQRRSHRLTETDRCVNTNTQTHPEPCTHHCTDTPQHTDTHPNHPRTPSGCHHTHTTSTEAHPHTKADVPDTDAHTFTSPAHSQPHSQKVSHSRSVTYMQVAQIQCHVHTVPHSVMQCHTPSVTVSHTPCHTPRVTHTQPPSSRCQPDSAGQTAYRSGP